MRTAELPCPFIGLCEIFTVNLTEILVHLSYIYFVDLICVTLAQ